MTCRRLADDAHAGSADFDAHQFVLPSINASPV